MANPTFTDALTTLRRRARLAGRSPSKQEVSGVVSGAYAGAEDRALRKKLEDDQLLQRRREQQQMERAARREEKVTGAGVGLAAGSALASSGAIGVGRTAFSLSGPVGWGIGLGLGLLARECIIVTACTDRHSPEVDITREFRDKFLGPVTLSGYYILAHYVEPLIRKHRCLRWAAKKVLVDSLIDYGRWFMHGNRLKHKSSKLITKLFLSLCYRIGNRQISKGVKYA